jgi:hypothetical protein
MQLSSMQLVRHAIPQTGTGWDLRAAGSRSEHPGVNRMTAKDRLILLTRLRQPILVPQLLGDQADVEMKRQTLVLQEAIEMFFANLYRTERLVPSSPDARTWSRLHIFDSNIRKRQNCG